MKMKISDYEKAALAKGVEIDEIRCKGGEVIICRGHYHQQKVTFDDEGTAFGSRGKLIPELNLF